MTVLETGFATSIHWVSALYHSLGIASRLELPWRLQLEVCQELQKNKSPIISYRKRCIIKHQSKEKEMLVIAITHDLDVPEQRWKAHWRAPKIPTKQQLLANTNIPLSRCYGSPSLPHPNLWYFLCSERERHFRKQVILGQEWEKNPCCLKFTSSKIMILSSASILVQYFIQEWYATNICSMILSNNREFLLLNTWKGWRTYNFPSWSKQLINSDSILCIHQRWTPSAPYPPVWDVLCIGNPSCS